MSVGSISESLWPDGRQPDSSAPSVGTPRDHGGFPRISADPMTNPFAVRVESMRRSVSLAALFSIVALAGCVSSRLGAGKASYDSARNAMQNETSSETGLSTTLAVSSSTRSERSDETTDNRATNLSWLDHLPKPKVPRIPLPLTAAEIAPGP